MCEVLDEDCALLLCGTYRGLALRGFADLVNRTSPIFIGTHRIYLYVPNREILRSSISSKPSQKHSSNVDSTYLLPLLSSFLLWEQYVIVPVEKSTQIVEGHTDTKTPVAAGSKGKRRLP